MHQAGYDALGLPFVYVPFAVEQADLAPALTGMRALGIRGFGVSMPFKLDVIPLLEDREEQIRENAHRVLRGGAYVKVLAQLRGLHTKASRFGGCPVEVDAHDMTVTNGVRTRPLGLVQVEHNAGVGYPVIQSRLRCHKASPRIPLPTVLGEDLTALFEQGLLRLRGRRRGDDLLLRERRAGPQRHQSDERSHHHLQIHDHGRNSSLSGRSRNSRHAR